MSNLIQKLSNKEISRRTFLKTGAVATAGLGLAGCGNELVSTNGTDINTTDGEWVSAACWHNCGGRCLNKAYVVDGVVIRQKTDDTREDTYDNPQQRACLRGRSQKFQAQGLDRIKYPMKRKNWEPGGGDKSLRGQDEWERISWDEALTYIADEITRIKETHGTEAILSTAYAPASVLSKLGTYVQEWGTVSFGSWWATPHIVGVKDSCMEISNLNDRLDMRKTELCVGFGLNSAWSALGNATNYYMHMKDKGCEFIIFDPIYTDTISLLGAEWVPIRPGTDVAVHFAMAYTLLDEDDPITNPLIDWDFLNKYCLGFDAEHMPTDARTDENFKDYVLGVYDGIPKTPEWAEEISGVSADKIRQISRKMGKNVKLALLTSWAPNRTFNNDNAPQLFMTLGAMGGHWGKSGHNTGVSCWNNTMNSGPALVVQGYSTGAGTVEEYTGPYYSAISLNDTEVWNGVLTGEFKPSSVCAASVTSAWKYASAGLDLTQKLENIKNPIQMIWHSDGANLQTRDSMNQGIEAHRQVEFVLSQSQFLTTNSKYSDIVLPVTTQWERGGYFGWSCNRDILIVNDNVIPAQYEAQDDTWIVNEIGMRLGLPDATYDLSERQMFFNQLVGCVVMKEDGTGYEALLTITEADIAEWGVEGTPQEGRVGIAKFLEDGIYQVERYEGDNYGHIAYSDFIADPEANPLCSTSGKFEIYSQTLSDLISNYGWSDVPPIPKYAPPTLGVEATYSDWDNKIKGDYPYQIINPHYQRRSHSVFDNIPYLREAFVQPVFISTTDALEKGVSNGDTILITSPYGQTLRSAYVTERITPGVVGLPHGAWSDVDEETGIDKAGADNILSGSNPTGQGVSGWNTNIVNFEKWDGDPVPRDVDVAQRIIF